MHLAPGYRATDPRLYYLECLTLLQSGYEVELVAHTANGEKLNPHVRLHTLGQYKPTLTWNLMDRMRRDRNAYTLARGSNASLYHYHSLEFIPWGKRLRHASGRPVIFDCREDYEGYARQRRGIPRIVRGPLARLIRRQLRLAARSSDAVIVADHGTASVLRPYARRLLVLHNFPRLELFPLRHLPADDQRYDLVYHGSVPKYHLEVCLAIDATLMQRGYKVRWRFIGYMPEKEWLLGELARRGITERFTISGPIPHDQIAAEVRKAKIGLIPLPNLPKFHKNVPQKLFEFMALRMPVVMSDLPPSRPFVGDGACAVMVPADDHRAYADAVIRLLQNPELRMAMGAEGRKRVEQKYNWDNESQKLVALYAELLCA